AKRFSAEVGVDDGAGKEGSVEFIVSGDGKVLWRSGVLKTGDPAKPVNVNLAGIKTLVLQVTDADDGESNDHADWANAKIEVSRGAALPVALPPYEAFNLG